MEAEKNLLMILEAYSRDIGHGIARIDIKAMAELGLSEDDVIEIRGRRTTAAKCVPGSTPQDTDIPKMQSTMIQEKQHKTKFDWTDKNVQAQTMQELTVGRTMRIDGLTRNNAGVSIGDVVKIRKVDALPAEKVTVVPLESIPPIDERYLADALNNVPVMKGDNVMVPYFGGRLTFNVVDIVPDAASVITQKTIFSIANQGPTLREVDGSRYDKKIIMINGKKIESLKTAVEECEKELLEKQETIKSITRNMLKENHKVEEIQNFLNTSLNEELLSIHQKLLNAYRQYVKELEPIIGRK